MATQSFVDTCRAIASKLEITNEVSPSILRVVDHQTGLFPSNLHLNNKGEEPPRLYMSSRGTVWRRVLSCMDESTRANYHLSNRVNELDYNYSNLSYRLGNICVHVLAVSDFDFPEVVEWAILK